MSTCINQPRAPIRVARARQVAQPSRATWLVVRQDREAPPTRDILAACYVDPRPRAPRSYEQIHMTRDGPEGWCVCGEDRAPRQRPCSPGPTLGEDAGARGGRAGARGQRSRPEGVPPSCELPWRPRGRPLEREPGWGGRVLLESANIKLPSRPTNHQIPNDIQTGVNPHKTRARPPSRYVRTPAHACVQPERPRRPPRALRR